MIKSEKGITLLSLVIVIALMTIISSTVVYMSLDRFEINNLRKMFIDIELLQDKVSNYYLKYGALPILRDPNNTEIEYGKQNLNFNTNSADDDAYYILDLEAMEGISLNYGKEGFKHPNTSKDIYIINRKSHTIYYVRGVELDGDKYYTSILYDSNKDTIPPSSPQINIISGRKNDKGKYITAVEIEIIPGKDAWSGVKQTEVIIIKDGTKIEPIKINDLYIITEVGKYSITATTEDNSGESSSAKTLEVEIVENKS